MSWVIKYHDGTETAIRQQDEDRIKQLASRLELVPVTLLDGNIIYIKPSSVAKMEKKHDFNKNVIDIDKRIHKPDYRGEQSDAKEKVREMLKEKGIL